MNKILEVLILLGIIILIALGSGFLGLIIGAGIGGSFFTEFRMFGVQGYEATGDLGGLIGIGIGLIVGIWFTFRKLTCGKF